MAKVKRVNEGESEYRIKFWCPGCESYHMPNQRWQFNEDYESPTLNPSILVTWDYGEERTHNVCHSFIREGRIQYLDDCTHNLKGQTVDLPDLESVNKTPK